jgi:hypothetical protein
VYLSVNDIRFFRNFTSSVRFKIRHFGLVENVFFSKIKDMKLNFIDACSACVIACEKCITTCIKEGNQSCILLCRDCADICALCARLAARNSPYSKVFCDLCAKVCKECADECAKHAAHHLSCKECEMACRECAASFSVVAL